ncbi:hypothetical protein BAE44_0016662 [Dichanthelium oligosanthes]|uniref:Uncharacterized protein n=1 Tax=Dichanthelium oligosanthes TaxID=888268 RepID=A0A1E5VB03_9POAL|nr:hypothetical protein BAE44_0016662 [Dichanthelium oligosanthes]
MASAEVALPPATPANPAAKHPPLVSVKSTRRYFLISRMRVLRRCGHVAYLIGLPILGYSLDIGKEHVNLIDEQLQKLIYSGQLDGKELDRLAVVSMAGLAAEGLEYDKVVGQSADLFTLQRFINRIKPQLSKDQQQNLTRWAVLFAASLLKNNKAAHEALMLAMSQKAAHEAS